MHRDGAWATSTRRRSNGRSNRCPFGWRRSPALQPSAPAPAVVSQAITHVYYRNSLRNLYIRLASRHTASKICRLAFSVAGAPCCWVLFLKKGQQTHPWAYFGSGLLRQRRQRFEAVLERSCWHYSVGIAPVCFPPHLRLPLAPVLGFGRRQPPAKTPRSLRVCIPCPVELLLLLLLLCLHFCFITGFYFVCVPLCVYAVLGPSDRNEGEGNVGQKILSCGSPHSASASLHLIFFFSFKKEKNWKYGAIFPTPCKQNQFFSPQWVASLFLSHAHPSFALKSHESGN